MGHNVAAIQLLKQMEKQHNIMPDLVSYSIVIDDLCKEGLVDPALELFLKMTCKGVAPDVVTYTSLIHGVCMLGRLIEAERLFNGMVDRNISPDVQTFNVLVDAFCEEAMVEKAQDMT